MVTMDTMVTMVTMDTINSDKNWNKARVVSIIHQNIPNRSNGYLELSGRLALGLITKKGTLRVYL